MEGNTVPADHATAYSLYFCPQEPVIVGPSPGEVRGTPRLTTNWPELLIEYLEGLG